MRITIEYDSCWQNSFLDGSNNEPLPKHSRTFIGTIASLKDANNFIKREITIDTVMGVLNRLIGDQRRLYQARNEEYGDYYFKNIEALVSFKDKPTCVNDNEVTYLRNISGCKDKSSFAGIVMVDDAAFTSDVSKEFWGVLALDFTELCQFIVEGVQVDRSIQLDPISIITRLEALEKDKPVLNEGIAAQALVVLNQHFPDANYINKKGNIYRIMFYCSSLYLQLSRLKDVDFITSKAGCISGISKRGVTKRDFMKRYSTGNGKIIFGNPYIRTEMLKGQGKVVHNMTKASGQLLIEIDIDRDKAKELKSMIENAATSSFYLGKKGLAYLTDIDTKISTRK